jgi:peroxiredoxin
LAAQSTMLDLGTVAPDFRLPDHEGKPVSRDDFGDARALLVVFLANHCPFVRHMRGEFARFEREYRRRGLATVGVSCNDVETYPQDGPLGMAAEAREVGYGFPYLFDEDQKVALAYRAGCTPDFFLFDGGRRLVYRGQFDASRPGNRVPVTGADLRAACDALLAGRPLPADQTPSMGCSIKWKAGNEPA